MGRTIFLVACWMLGSLFGCTAVPVALVNGPQLHGVKQELEENELGPAVMCEWRNHQPSFCVYDETRVTINTKLLTEKLDLLKELKDAIEEYKQEKYRKRAL